MKNLKNTVLLISAAILLICVYSFLLGNEVFAGKFTNSFLAWYMLAKGLFCSAALCLLAIIAGKK